MSPLKTLRTKPLSPRFGVEVLDIDLATVDFLDVFPAIRACFEHQSALLFRNQKLPAQTHMRLAEMFGPLEDRKADEKLPSDPFEISQLSNVTANGGVTGAMELHTLSLKSNQLWHTDSTFLPIPALVNILTAKIVTETGGETEIASTRLAWHDMPETLKKRIRGRGIHHRFSHSRAKIDAELARQHAIIKWPDTHWNSIWRNPVTGEDALYIASHAFRIDGMDEAASEVLLTELTEFCTQPEYVYSHKWTVGDVLIWDERATIHRGQPWDYSKPRALASICSSVTEADGLSSMRMV
ncbi:MAG: TauD/TfdA family dioxygenase [Rhodobacterales bacterium]